MYYVDFEKGCSPTELNVKERASYVLPKGMVKVEVSAFGINRADTLQRQGHYPPPPGESAILGLEVAGTVVEVAPDVSNFKQGDRVFGLVAGGGYATEAIVNPAHLMPIPENMPFLRPRV